MAREKTLANSKRHSWSAWRAISKDRSGIAAVEFAILVPVLALLAVCTADLGMAIYADMQVQNSAQAGTGYALLHGFDSSAISSAVTGASSLSGLSASPAPTQFCGCPSNNGVVSTTCGSSCSTGNTAGTYVTASATAVYNTILPYPIVPRQFTLVSQSTVRIK
jgi:Flp pilus assembly protein TadG